jgi:hypothetical protein
MVAKFDTNRGCKAQFQISSSQLSSFPNLQKFASAVRYTALYFTCPVVCAADSRSSDPATEHFDDQG